MAKSNPPSSRSRVRMFFVDADLAPGDMDKLTTALSSAIRPTHMIQRIAPPARLSGDNGDGASGLEAVDDAGIDVVDSLAEDDGEEEERGPAKPRKYRSPKPVTDLNMSAGGKPFEEYAREKGNPPAHQARYLVAAQWLSEYAQLPTVSVDHIYTCYKAADWTFDVSDPGFPFRQLKKDGFGDTKRGKFTINHLGAAKVKKMKGEGE